MKKKRGRNKCLRMNFSWKNLNSLRTSCLLIKRQHREYRFMKGMGVEKLRQEEADQVQREDLCVVKQTTKK